MAVEPQPRNINALGMALYAIFALGVILSPTIYTMSTGKSEMIALGLVGSVATHIISGLLVGVDPAYL